LLLNCIAAKDEEEAHDKIDEGILTVRRGDDGGRAACSGIAQLDRQNPACSARKPILIAKFDYCPANDE